MTTSGFYGAPDVPTNSVIIAAADSTLLIANAGGAQSRAACSRCLHRRPSPKAARMIEPPLQWPVARPPR